jgi:ketosteroid isomerase-like protein
LSAHARGEKEEGVAEVLIRQRVEDWVKALRAKDIAIVEYATGKS